MALVATQTPSYPVPGKQLRVDFTPSASVNFVRIWVTDAPQGSSEKRRLDEAGATRLKIHEGDTGKPWSFTPDTGGVYVFAAQEYTLNAANFGGDYKDDPDGYKSEAEVGSEQTITVTAGQKLSMPIGTGEDRATLELWIWGDTVRPTTFELHGEKTPSITGAVTARAKTAATDSTTVSALAALENIVASTALGNIATKINEHVTDLNAHFARTASHASADTANTIPDGFLSPTDTKGIIAAAQRCARALKAHMDSDDGTGIGEGSWHQVAGSDRADLENTLLVDPPSDMAGVIAYLADGFRAYEAHRASTTYHTGGADGTNTLAALSPLLEVHRAFLASLRSTSPPVPATVNSGVPVLVNGAGMKEV